MGLERGSVIKDKVLNSGANALSSTPRFSVINTEAINQPPTPPFINPLLGEWLLMGVGFFGM